MISVLPNNDNIQSDDLETIIKDNSMVVLDFYADWCGPCKKITPLLEFFAKSYSNLKIIKINIENNDEIADKYNIQSLPTLIFFHKTKKIITECGCQPGAINIITALAKLLITSKCSEESILLNDTEFEDNVHQLSEDLKERFQNKERLQNSSVSKN